MQDSPFKNISVPLARPGAVDINNTGLNFGDIINASLPYIFGAAGIILLLNVITSGFKLMTSQGDPKAVGAAQAKLTTSAIGILILITSFWIVKLLLNFLGIGVSNPVIN